MIRTIPAVRLTAVFLTGAIAIPALAQDVPHTAPADAGYSPYLESNYPDQEFFSGSHL